jgi:hypothetical protein
MRRYPFRTARTAVALVRAAGRASAAGGADDQDGARGSADTSSTTVADAVQGSVASYDLAVGPARRFMFGMYNEAKGPVGYGTAQFSFFFLGTDPKACGGTTREPGPTATARYLHLDSEKPHAGDTSKPIYVDQKGVYAADVAFDRAGWWGLAAVVDVEGPKEATSCFAVQPRNLVPAPGDPAPASQNLTLTTPGAPPEAIDSRASARTPVPDPELHQTTVAQALAEKRPVVLVVSTPTYCVSQFCGPVTDTVAELAKTYGNRARFIHIEVFKDYKAKELKDRLNEAAAEWIAREANPNPTEPWVFLIGADGKVSARFDNIATRAELEPLLQKLPVMKG